MDFKYIRKLKPFIILAMIFIFMPVITKAGGLVPTDFNGFAVTSDNIVIVGDNTAVTGYKDNEKVFSFELAFKNDYALSVNQNNNIVIYTKNARFVFAQDGTPLTFNECDGAEYESLKNRKVVTSNSGIIYILTNKLGFMNEIIKIENGKQSTVYKTPTAVLLAEFAFWEGNLILVVCFVAGLLDVRKRRFLTKTVKNSATGGLTEKPESIEEVKQKVELPKFLKAFTKPELSNKGAAFSSEYSTKPGEKPKFLETKENKTDDNEVADNK
ncbi:MAG: hypothetical protein J6Q87_01785 [Clostridia bacterium]|nr:hypothetical protein [Clostridia bacterium]